MFLCDDRPGTYTARGSVDYYNSQTGNESSYGVSTTFTLKAPAPSVSLNRSKTFGVSYNSPYWSSVTKYGSTAKATDKRWRVTGKLARQGDSSYGGRRIYLQRWTGTKWAAATSCVTASTGRCSVALRPPRRSNYRWYVPATARVKADTSATFILTRRA